MATADEIIASIHKKIIEKANNGDLVKKVAKVVLQALVDKTPVDTSKAISNYQVGLVIPIRTEKNAFFPGKAGTTAGESGAEVIRRGNLVINQRKTGDAIYITNNADYVVKLDNVGRKGPFIKPAVLKGRRVAKNG